MSSCLVAAVLPAWGADPAVCAQQSKEAYKFCLQACAEEAPAKPARPKRKDDGDCASDCATLQNEMMKACVSNATENKKYKNTSKHHGDHDDDHGH